MLCVAADQSHCDYQSNNRFAFCVTEIWKVDFLLLFFFFKIRLLQAVVTLFKPGAVIVTQAGLANGQTARTGSHVLLLLVQKHFGFLTLVGRVNTFIE